MKTTNKTTIITYQAWFAAFVAKSTVDETSFEADQTSFDTDETRFESNQTSFGPNLTTFKANVTTFDPNDASFIPHDVIDKSMLSRGAARYEVSSASNVVKFASNVVTFALNVVKFDPNEVTSGSHAFIPMMNTTLSGAVATTFASDATFFATEQVTSVAEEIIGDALVMFLSTINKPTWRMVRLGKLYTTVQSFDLTSAA